MIRSAHTLVPCLTFVLLAGCGGGGARPLDLLGARANLLEAKVASLSPEATLAERGTPVRLNDVLYRSLPAGPPSRWRFKVEVAAGSVFRARCAVAERFHDRPGVEFVVKAVRDGREEVVATKLLDPLQSPKDREWVTFEAGLAKAAGASEIVLETRGFEESGEAHQAYWGAPAVVVPRAKAPLVIVYLVDTLRADHTGVYGYARDTTPALDAFAKDAVVFDAAIASASWTKPSVASLFTSLPPGRHRAVQLRDRLDDSVLTLAELLQAKGFATGAAIANSVIYLPEANFQQGFDYFEGLHGEEGRPSKIVEAAPVVDRALEWLEARRGLPTFLYVHTMDPHVPYTPPAPFDRKYEPHPTPEHPGQDPRTDYKEPGDRERLVAQYDGEIAYGDREFGRFLRVLRERGLYQGALVAFLADHGEEFMDHGQWLHGRSVFDELVRVPLVVKLPGGQSAGRRITQQVQVVDLLPTVLESQGLPVPEAPAVVGRPLQAVLGAAGAIEVPALSEISHRGIVAHGLRTARDKYIERFSPETDELYFDLVKDPKEQASARGTNPERERRLRAGIEAAFVPNPFRYVVRAAGAGAYTIRVKTSGYVISPQGSGLGPEESYEVAEGGHVLVANLRPRAGSARELAFNVRPRGAPVSLDGTRDGRALRPAEVALGQGGFAPPAVPLTLPQLEAGAEAAPRSDLFAAASGRSGLSVWLVLDRGQQVMAMDKDTCERMKALGYVGSCAGL